MYTREKEGPLQDVSDLKRFVQLVMYAGKNEESYIQTLL